MIQKIQKLRGPVKKMEKKLQILFFVFISILFQFKW